MSLILFAGLSYPWWANVGAPIANHLWQSTLFAAIAGFLTLPLRKNPASTRYTVWLLASLKFLVPFSLLVGLGSQMHWSKASTTPPAEFVAVIEGFGQPFAARNTAPRDAPAMRAVLALIVRVLGASLLLIWLAGFVAVLVYWWSRLRRIIAAAHDAKPMEAGREWNAFLRLQENAGLRQQIRLIVSHSALEPGILGIFRPVLILPAGLSDRLSDAQLAAIFTHELCHVRRRDNLCAALHMLAEALFWFHPLVWWLGARLVDERERACDEEVLALGSDPQDYAESILKICEFYMESPLLCASGVTGSNLKKRIEVIMRHHAPMNLNFARKLLLSSAGFLAVAIPIVFGLLHVTQSRAQSQLAENAKTGPAFASATVTLNKTGDPMPGLTVKMPEPRVPGMPMRAVQFRPDRFMATNTTLQELIQLAYHVQSTEILGSEAWLPSDRYDVDARISNVEMEKLHALSSQQASAERHGMIQALLAEHFQLALHRETRQIPVYALVVVPGGPKLQLAKPGDTYPNGIQYPNGKPIVPGLLSPKEGQLVGQGIPISHLVESLADKLDRPLLDKTGLTGNYDFILDWTPDGSSATPNAAVFAALEQQLGLKLEPQDDPVEVLVIDHAEKPAETAGGSADAQVVAPH
jgi:bla regulator protein blaR1